MKDELIKLKNKLEQLRLEEQIKRDLYLKKLANGTIQGPLTNYPSIDKEWMKYYTDEQIAMQKMPKMRMIDYMQKENLNDLDDVAIEYFGTKLTFKEFFEKIDECAKSLVVNGIGKGDKVTICMPSTPEVLIMVYAINKIGAVANMVHPLSSENQIKEFINRVDSKLVITIDQTYEKVDNIRKDTNVNKVVVVSPSDSMPAYLKLLYPLTKDATKIKDKSGLTTWKDFMKEGKEISYVPDCPYEENREAIILQTGGTTGVPKGVVLTDDNFNGMVEQFKIDASKYERGDKMLTIMPPFHGFGLCSSMHLPLSFGVGVVLIPRVNIKEIDKLITKNKISHIVAVPTLFKGMMKVVREKEAKGKIKNFDLSGLKYVVSGGALAKNGFEADVDKFLEEHGCKVKLNKGYGLSEAVAGATFATDEMKNENTVGIPMIATQIKIVDPETKEELQNGEIGEICVKSAAVMKEYYNNIEETNKTLINGWLHTGDLGYFEAGELYFSERKGNMIISSGVNVYPSQIEEIIETHPAVSACAVIGVHHPYKQEVPKAYVVLKPEYEANDRINDEISELCKKNLDRYSWPASIEYKEELPQTLLGKISHKKLKEESKVKVFKK